MATYKKAGRILLWVCVFVFMGCSPSRQLDKAINTLNKHPDKAAQFCVNKYPSVIDTVIYHDSIIKFDTLYEVTPVQIDTVYKKDTTIITVSSPTRTIIKTITQTKEVIKEPTAKIEEQRQLYLECEGRYRVANTKLEAANLSAKQWKERFWWLLLVACALAGYIIRKPVSKIISKIPL